MYRTNALSQLGITKQYNYKTFTTLKQNKSNRFLRAHELQQFPSHTIIRQTDAEEEPILHPDVTKTLA